jgi:hypothetical protein
MIALPQGQATAFLIWPLVQWQSHWWQMEQENHMLCHWLMISTWQSWSPPLVLQEFVNHGTYVYLSLFLSLTAVHGLCMQLSLGKLKLDVLVTSGSRPKMQKTCLHFGSTLQDFFFSGKAAI